jgi:hypothetical protein
VLIRTRPLLEEGKRLVEVDRLGPMTDWMRGFAHWPTRPA